jgi:hypothetical protein
VVSKNPMLDDPNLLLWAGANLPTSYQKIGFDRDIAVLVYDDKDCNVIVCCMYQGRHYHIPTPCPRGGMPSAAAKKVRDQSETFLNRFVSSQLERLVYATPEQRLFMEVPDPDTGVATIN